MADDQLKNLVIDRALNDESLSEEAQLVVLAAMESEADLESALSPDATPSEVRQRISTPVAPPAEATGTFLRSITVQGFRGIGNKVRIDLPTKPGLVVIAGRNGSGKSSLAEALEIALTGVNSRWEGMTEAERKLWAGKWRNLHAGVQPEVRIGVTEEGQGITTLGTDWPTDTDAPVGAGKRWAQRHGAKQEPIDALGWERALELYRPLLSYDELGSILEGSPKDFYDQLFRLLGLEQLTEGINRLDAAVRRLKEPASSLATLKKAAKAALEAVGEPDALALAKEVNRHQPPIELVRPYVVGGVSQSIPQAWSRAAEPVVPDEADVAAAAHELRAAAADASHQSDAEQVLAADRLTLLEQALAFHDEHGEGTCPVCGTGSVDAAWASEASTRVAASRAASSALSNARSRLQTARSRVKALIVAVPSVPDDDQLDSAAATSARAGLEDVPPDGDLSLADHLERAMAAVRTAFHDLAVHAQELIASHQNAWEPAIAVLAQWLAVADLFVTTEAPRKIATDAQKWLADNADQLRNERLAPMADQSAQIWSVLRQESNVGLGAIRLTGKGNHRKVELMAAVDGTAAEAFSVMSQGELHALALAVFLPRAAARASPFRFVVLDDPIQAMDPSKIDGFLEVMNQIGQTHQVIVLTHDDRLPAAIRRRNVDARMFEVTRGAQSAVMVTESMRPALRCLEEGWAVVKDQQVPVEIKNRTIPTLCREAFEDTVWEVFAGRALSAGWTLSAVEAAWEDAQTAKKRLALALHLDVAAELKPWLHGHRAQTMHVINSGLHDGVGPGAAENALESTKKTLADLRSVLG
ncbi:MAG: AAA family ATPase [Nakamurella sp.]